MRDGREMFTQAVEMMGLCAERALARAELRRRGCQPLRSAPGQCAHFRCGLQSSWHRTGKDRSYDHGLWKFLRRNDSAFPFACPSGCAFCRRRKTAVDRGGRGTDGRCLCDRDLTRPFVSGGKLPAHDDSGPGLPKGANGTCWRELTWAYLPLMRTSFPPLGHCLQASRIDQHELMIDQHELIMISAITMGRNAPKLAIARRTAVQDMI